MVAIDTLMTLMTLMTLITLMSLREDLKKKTEISDIVHIWV